ncbi:MAG: purine-nucleoside phosphorylase [Chloroflexota bacterium]
MTDTPADYTAAVDAIRSRINNAAPQIGLVLGSGLGTLADELDNRIVIPYSDIPGWPQSTVHGHSGNLVIGELEGKLVVTQQGRAHFYEGYTPQQITFPIRVMHFLGVKTLILTNAAGGMNTDFSVGDIMVINDHIYFIGMAGVSPLVGPNDESNGERFVGMAQTYDRELRTLAEKVAADSGETLQKGVYVCVSGPQFETPTEIRALRMMGGDAVGMSTAHEVVTARHAGMRVLAFSSITNIAIDEIDTELETSHVEVMEAGAVIVPKLAKIVRGVVREMSV